LEKTIVLNSFIFLNEEQDISGSEVIYNSPYFDLVRNIGWCDQKATALVFLLEKQNIKARAIYMLHHTVAEVWIDGVYRFFDPTANCYFVHTDDKSRLATFEEVLNKSDTLLMSNGNSFAAYGLRGAMSKDYLIAEKSDPVYLKIVSKVIDAYYFVGGDYFCGIFQDFYFFTMETFRGGQSG
jgi:transglutaminase-like putative cysteine protease